MNRTFAVTVEVGVACKECFACGAEARPTWADGPVSPELGRRLVMAPPAVVYGEGWSRLGAADDGYSEKLGQLFCAACTQRLLRLAGEHITKRAPQEAA